jgi:hypothetical protein
MFKDRYNFGLFKQFRPQNFVEKGDNPFFSSCSRVFNKFQVNSIKTSSFSSFDRKQICVQFPSEKFRNNSLRFWRKAFFVERTWFWSIGTLETRRTRDALSLAVIRCVKGAAELASVPSLRSNCSFSLFVQFFQ